MVDSRSDVQVKLISGILTRQADDLDRCFEILERSFGPIDFRSQAYPFDLTRYYQDEMGPDLTRIWVAFDDLVDPTSLVAAKWATRDIEKTFQDDGQRRINLDPGYLDLFKIVLASFKPRANKLYVGRDIWADMVAYFERGKFRTFPWSFPDFQQGVYDSDLISIRERFKNQLRGS